MRRHRCARLTAAALLLAGALACRSAFSAEAPPAPAVAPPVSAETPAPAPPPGSAEAPLPAAQLAPAVAPVPAAAPPGSWAPPSTSASPVLSAAPAPVAPAALPRAGLFGVGINLDLLELGPIQVFARGGKPAGFFVSLGLEIDLGPYAAFRLPLKAAIVPGSTTIAGENDAGSFLEVALAPALVYRFRDTPGQRWVPFVLGGVDLGAFQFGRALLGLDPSPMGTAQAFTRAGIAPNAGGGVLFTPVPVFSVRFAATYTYLFVAHTSVSVLEETVALRLSF